MSGTIKKTTGNYNLRIPYFDKTGWGREMERNFDIVDAVLFAVSNLSNIIGVWQNSIEYDQAQRVVDDVTNTLWQATADHVSAASGTFAEARAASPGLWNQVSQTFNNVGQWTTSTNYVINDIMVQGYQWAIAINNFTSTTSLADDILAGNLVEIIDFTTVVGEVDQAVLDALAAQSAAELAEANAELAETNAETAEFNAELAEANAMQYAQDAEDARDAAQLAQIAAETAETNAETAETNAELAETNAELAQLAAEAAQLAAEDARDLALLAQDGAELAETNAETAQLATEDARDLSESYRDEASLIVGAATQPVGSVMMVYGDGTDVPPGYLLMTGFSVTAAYPDLRTFGLNNGWDIDGNGDPICPDMGGYFARGWRSGQVVDSGRVFGSAQADQMQQINGSFEVRSSVTPGAPNVTEGKGAITTQVNSGVAGAAGTSLGATQTRDLVTFDSADSPGARVGDETHPANVTFTYWIKAYQADQVPGSVEFAELVNDVQKLQILPFAKAPAETEWIDATTVRVKPGKFCDETGTRNIEILANIDVTLPGGTTANKGYHLLAGIDGSGSSVVIITETNALPSGWQCYRRIWSIRTDATGTIREYKQYGDRCIFVAALQDLTGSVAVNSLYDLPLPVGVPVDARCRLLGFTNAAYLTLASPDEAAPSNTSSGSLASLYTPGSVAATTLDVPSSTGQLRLMVNAATSWRVSVLGWLDRRGKDK